MRTTSKLLLAGAGAIALAGVAMAAADRAHVMNVALPDGTIAHVHYVGDVAPRVVVQPVADTIPVAFMNADPFAMFERVALAMDRQMDAMLQQASALANVTPDANGQIRTASLESLPPGTVSYSVTSYSSGNGGQCRQSVQVTSLGSNQTPKVVKQSSGDCNAMNSRGPTMAAAPAAPETPKLTHASLEKTKEPAPKGPVI